MTWNWQQPDWPIFVWEARLLQAAERLFIERRGTLSGITRHIADAEQNDLLIHFLSDEAIATSAIEGDMLDRSSLRASLRNALGISTENPRAGIREQAIVELALLNYQTAAEPVQARHLFQWHELLMRGRRDISTIGNYRTFSDAMQIVSGSGLRPKVYFEAPPSTRVDYEMQRFYGWLEKTHPDGLHPLPAITRAGIAHLYFESVHPFEDGNGRIGRALSEKVFAQDAPDANMVLLSATLLRFRKEYYDQLAAANTANEITAWLRWFAEMVLTAQYHMQRLIEHTIAKTQFFDMHRSAVNERQTKALQRMFDAGVDGFIGGMSAGKYVGITGCSTATATRDLAELTALPALRAAGDRRHRRYHLNISILPDARARITESGQVVFETMSSRNE